MLRSLFGQLLSALVIVGILVGWWLAADQNFGVMMQQAFNLALWIGGMFEPLVGGLFSQANP